ncbi:hypothetical protein C8J56DRAFT_838010, partial [Mycena floridula]
MRKGFLLRAQQKGQKRDAATLNSVSGEKTSPLKSETKKLDSVQKAQDAKYAVLYGTGAPAGDTIGAPSKLSNAGKILNPEDDNSDEDELAVVTLPPPEYPNLPNRSDGFTQCFITGYTKNAVLDYPGFPAAVPQPVTPAHKIVQTATKGLGVFTTRKVLVGELLFAERPLLITPQGLWVSDDVRSADNTKDRLHQIALDEREKRLEILLNRFDSDADKVRVMALHNSHKEDGSGPILGIVRTNGFGAPKELRHRGLEGIKYDYSILCDQGSRINHSCSPNITCAWDAASFCMKFRAVRNVEAGEEITFSYCDALAPRADRQKELKPYGFKCTCTACLHPEISDPRRQTLERFFRGCDDDDTLRKLIAEKWFPLADLKFIQTFKEHFDMCELEGLHGTSAYRTSVTMLKSRSMWLAHEQDSL